MSDNEGKVGPEDDTLGPDLNEWKTGPYARYARQFPQDFRPYAPMQLWNKMEPKFYDKYFEVLERTGLFRAAADAVGCHVNHIQIYRRDNPEFEEMVLAALDRFKDAVMLEAQRRAMEGIPEPVLGGRNRDQIVAWRLKYSDRILELFLKKVDPDGFGDKSKVEVQATIQDNFKFGEMSPEARRIMRALIHQIKLDNGEIAEDPDPLLGQDVRHEYQPEAPASQDEEE